MKISNFELKEVIKTSSLGVSFVATVTVTTGVIFKRQEHGVHITRQIGGCWFFCADGSWLPGEEVGKAERVFEAARSCPISDFPLGVVGK